MPVVVASTVLGRPVLPTVIPLRAAEVGDSGENESVTEQSEGHPVLSSAARRNTLTGGPLGRHVKVGAEKRQYVVAVDAEAEDVEIHTVNLVLSVSALQHRQVHRGAIGAFRLVRSLCPSDWTFATRSGAPDLGTSRVPDN